MDGFGRSGALPLTGAATAEVEGTTGQDKTVRADSQAQGASPLQATCCHITMSVARAHLWMAIRHSAYGKADCGMDYGKGYKYRELLIWACCRRCRFLK
jgi:hypothetical protein